MQFRLFNLYIVLPTPELHSHDQTLWRPEGQSSKEGKLSAYLLYACGEILPVVIVILIALQIDNMNDARKQRELEVRYFYNTFVVDRNPLVDNFFWHVSGGQAGKNTALSAGVFEEY